MSYKLRSGNAALRTSQVLRSGGSDVSLTDSDSGHGTDNVFALTTGGSVFKSASDSGIATDMGSLNVSMPAMLGVYVDWNKDGSYGGSYDDVTWDVRNGVSCEYGRDQITALSPVVAGRAGFTLDNRSKRYSPRNASSPLYGNIKPARPVKITRTLGGTTYIIFAGHTDDNPINPDTEERTVSLSAVDSLADLRGHNISTPLYQSITTGQAIGYVLDAAGWSGGRDIDSGSTIIPWFWVEDRDAFTVMQELLASEGPPALLTMSETGVIIFRDRQHRYVRNNSTISQATWYASGVTEPVMGKGFTYSDAWQNVVNDVSFTVDERAPSGDLVSIWDMGDSALHIPAGTTVDLWVETSDPFRGAVAPSLAAEDYAVVGGSVTNAVISRTSGQSLKLSLTATNDTTIVNLRIRGFSVSVARSYQVKASDATSISDFGSKSMPSGMTPVWANRYDAQSIADVIVAQHKDPLPILEVHFPCQHTQLTRLAAVLSRDLSDRVTVIEPETAVNGPFYVESIRHNIEDVTEHEVVFGLEAVPSVPGPTSLFKLNSSVLNGVNTLGY